MKFLNCTPHPITLVNEEGVEIFTLPKGEVIPRLTQTTQVVGEVMGIPITETQFGQTTDLPEPQEGVLLVVSRLVLTANPERKDLLVPNEMIRNAEGHIVGCKSLARN